MAKMIGQKGKDGLFPTNRLAAALSTSSLCHQKRRSGEDAFLADVDIKPDNECIQLATLGHIQLNCCLESVFI